MAEQEMKDCNYDPNKLPKTINKSKGKRRNHEKNKFKNDNNEGTNGMHNNKNINNSDNNNNSAHPIKNYNKFNRPLTAQHIQAVGAPRSEVSPNNVHGFSKNQHSILLFMQNAQMNESTNQSNHFVNTGYNNNNQNNYNNLQYQNNSSNSHNNNTGGDFASWANGSTYTPIAHNGIHNNTMCMLKLILRRQNLNQNLRPRFRDLKIQNLDPEMRSRVQNLKIIQIFRLTSSIQKISHTIELTMKQRYTLIEKLFLKVKKTL